MATTGWPGRDAGERLSGAAPAWLAATLALLLGCVTMTPGGGPTPVMKATGSKLSAAEIGEARTDLAFRIPAMIEETGDEILLRADTPLLRKHALLWKIEGTAAFQQAFYRPDAFEAAVATYTLAVQIEQWVQRGEGSSYFGEAQPIAVDGARRIRRDIEGAALDISRDPKATRARLEQLAEWAREHPIDERFTNRPSVRPVLSQMASTEKLGTSDVLSGLTGSLTDFGSRVDAYAVTLPKVIRWQSELAAIELSEADTGKLALATLQMSNHLLARVDDLTSQEGMERISRTAENALLRERVAVLADLDRQRRELLDNVDEQRVATLADVDRKIGEALATADAIRARTLAGVEDVATRTLWRAALAVACLMVLGAVLVFLLRLGSTARRKSPGSLVAAPRTR
jgi:hypothetical protein